MRLIDADVLKKTLCEEYEAREHYIGEKMIQAIDNAPTIIWCSQTSEGLPLMDMRVKPQSECKSCMYLDPEDRKCDCGGMERQGCIFSVSDDYYCKYYEKGGAE